MSYFDIDVMNAFFVERWGQRKCEICDAQSWSWMMNETNPYVGQPCINPQDQLTTVYWPASALVCGNCGNMKLVSHITVWDWYRTPEGGAKVMAFKTRFVQGVPQA